MIPLAGATIDMTSTGYLVVRWCGLTHFVKLSASEHDVFLALERCRVEVEAEQAAKSDRTANARGVILRERQKAWGKAASS